MRVLIRLVRAGHVFSLKLSTNNHKLNVFGSFLVHPDLKDLKSLFINGKLFGIIISPLTLN